MWNELWRERKYLFLSVKEDRKAPSGETMSSNRQRTVVWSTSNSPSDENTEEIPCTVKGCPEISSIQYCCHVWEAISGPRFYRFEPIKREMTWDGAAGLLRAPIGWTFPAVIALRSGKKSRDFSSGCCSVAWNGRMNDAGICHNNQLSSNEEASFFSSFN